MLPPGKHSQFAIENCPVEIVDLPIQRWWIFPKSFCKPLPEGKISIYLSHVSIYTSTMDPSWVIKCFHGVDPLRGIPPGIPLGIPRQPKAQNAAHQDRLDIRPAHAWQGGHRERFQVVHQMTTRSGGQGVKNQVIDVQNNFLG